MLKRTKRVSKARNWLYTINNPTDADKPDDWKCKFNVYQVEKGENGTEHFQGYIMFEQPVTIAGLKKLNMRAHWEMRKGTHAQALAYCTKLETRIDGPYYFGTAPKQGSRNDLLDLKLSLDKGDNIRIVAENHFSSFLKYSRGIQLYKNLITKPRSYKSEVTVFYGPTGVGKTKICNERFPDAYWIYPQQNGKWLDGYDSHEIVIIDEFYGWFPHNYMLRLLDRYPMKVETKGGYVEFIAKKIFITSNKEPFEWYPKMAESFPQLSRRIDNVLFKPSLDEDFIVISGKKLNEIFGEPDIVVVEQNSVIEDTESEIEIVTSDDEPLPKLTRTVSFCLPRPADIEDEGLLAGETLDDSDIEFLERKHNLVVKS